MRAPHSRMSRTAHRRREAHSLHSERPMPNELAKVMTGEIDRAVAGLEPMWDAVPEHIEDAPTARVMPFANRLAAGSLLGQALSHHARCNGVVLGIAHGGVAVAHG